MKETDSAEKIVRALVKAGERSIEVEDLYIIDEDKADKLIRRARRLLSRRRKG